MQWFREEFRFMTKYDIFVIVEWMRIEARDQKCNHVTVTSTMSRLSITIGFPNADLDILRQEANTYGVNWRNCSQLCILETKGMTRPEFSPKLSVQK